MDQDGAASTLRWWQEAGVDTLVDETPRNWLAPAAAPELRSPAPRPLRPPRPFPTGSTPSRPG